MTRLIQSISRNKGIWIILIAVIVIYGLLYTHIMRNFPDVVNGADHHWSTIGENLYRHGAYSLGKRDAQGELIPTLFTPPIYPLLYAASFTIFGEGRMAHEAMRILQILMNIGIVLIVYHAGSAWNKRIGLAAAFFAATDLSMFYFANNYESPHIALGFFVALSMLFVIRFFKKRSSYTNIILASLSLGLAVWTKEAAYLLWIPIAFTVFLWACYDAAYSIRKRALLAGFFILIASSFFWGWKIRNYYATGSSAFTSHSGSAMLWSASYIDVRQQGISFGKAYRAIQQKYITDEVRQLSEGEQSRYLEEIAKKKILSSPVDYIIAMVKGWYPLMLGTFPPYAMYSSETTNQLIERVSQLKGHRQLLPMLWERGSYLYLALLILPKLLLLIFYIASITGVWYMYRGKRDPWVLLTAVLIIGYTLAVTSPSSYSGYRTLGIPAFYILSGYGLISFIEHSKRFRNLN